MDKKAILVFVFAVALVAGVVFISNLTSEGGITGDFKSLIKCDYDHWPQHVLVNSVPHVCTAEKPYCYATTASCCKYTTTNGYYDCTGVKTPEGRIATAESNRFYKQVYYSVATEFPLHTFSIEDEWGKCEEWHGHATYYNQDPNIPISYTNYITSLDKYCKSKGYKGISTGYPCYMQSATDCWDWDGKVPMTKGNGILHSNTGTNCKAITAVGCYKDAVSAAKDMGKAGVNYWSNRIAVIKNKYVN